MAAIVISIYQGGGHHLDNNNFSEHSIPEHSTSLFICVLATAAGNHRLFHFSYDWSGHCHRGLVSPLFVLVIQQTQQNTLLLLLSVNQSFLSCKSNILVQDIEQNNDNCNHSRRLGAGEVETIYG